MSYPATGLTASELADLTAEHLQAALSAAPGELVRVHRGLHPTRPPGPWVTLYSSAGEVDRQRLAAVLRFGLWRTRAVCCGYSDAEAIRTADLVRNALTGWRPQPQDRSVGSLTEDSFDAPLIRDAETRGGSRPSSGGAQQTDNRWSITLSYRLGMTRN